MEGGVLLSDNRRVYKKVEILANLLIPLVHTFSYTREEGDGDVSILCGGRVEWLVSISRTFDKFHCIICVGIVISGFMTFGGVQLC